MLEMFFKYANFEVTTLGGLLTSERAVSFVLTIDIVRVFTSVIILVVAGLLLFRWFIVVIGQKEEVNYG